MCGPIEASFPPWPVENQSPLSSHIISEFGAPQHQNSGSPGIFLKTEWASHFLPSLAAELAAVRARLCILLGCAHHKSSHLQLRYERKGLALPPAPPLFLTLDRGREVLFLLLQITEAISRHLHCTILFSTKKCNSCIWEGRFYLVQRNEGSLP